LLHLLLPKIALKLDKFPVLMMLELLMSHARKQPKLVDQICLQILHA